MVIETLEPGKEIDGFRLGDRIHAGELSDIYRVTRPDMSFPAIMKVPRVGPNRATEGLIGFETEAMIVPALSGPHVPRFVAAGDLAGTPYLVVEWIEGESLADIVKRGPLPAKEVARVGAAVADALHSLHQQNAIHLDLKPENVILDRTGKAVLVDFGFSYHAHYPDLLAEEKRFAAGSAPYISPEQVLGTRSDSRSDIFSLGVVLYEMTTHVLPFGIPLTRAGLRDRLWIEPAPPRALSPGVPPWLQEIVLRCLEPRASERYQSAAHVALDLRRPDRVELTERASSVRRAGVFAQALRWWRARGGPPSLRQAPRALARAVPVVMVAVDTTHPDDPRQPELRRATAQILSLAADFRLVCVSVIRSGPTIEGSDPRKSASALHLEHLSRLRVWAQLLALPPNRLSLHVIESSRPADALLEFARHNNTDHIIVGAPGPEERALAWWRSVASGITANAHCSVHVVRIPSRKRSEPGS